MSFSRPTCVNPSLDGKTRLCSVCSREQFERAGKAWPGQERRVQYMGSDRFLAYAAARADRVAQVALIVGDPSEPRLAWLRAASSELGALAPKVYSVYKSTLPLEIGWLREQGLLTADVAERLTVGFCAAARACLAKGLTCLNSAGKTPRRAMIKAGVTFADMVLLLGALAARPVDDALANAGFTFYGMLHDEPRSKPFEPFPNGYIAAKYGDTYKYSRLHGGAHVTLQSPVAWRYGSSIYESVRAEFFLSGYATRAMRAAVEMTGGWLASESEARGSFAPSNVTGEEGFFAEASLAQAERALDAVREQLYTSDVFKKVFDVERGYCPSGGSWQLESF